MEWECASCDTTVRTGHRPAGPLHDCPGMKLSFPLVKAGERTRNRINLREDYLYKGDIPQRDGEGNYVMSVNTDYPDGRSALTIYPPTTIVSGQWL